jgi:hypothetical protein
MTIFLTHTIINDAGAAIVMGIESAHVLGRQLGYSTDMIHRDWSKYNKLLNAVVHSGPKRLKLET